jgi:hypothetical protein
MRPLIDPEHGPMTPAERQRRRRAGIGPKTLNRIRRRKRRAKRAAERKASRANGAQRTATKHAVAAATIAALGETIRRLSGGQVPLRGIPKADSLAGYTVETIEQHDALPLILQHEWLGNIGKAGIFIGLLSPERELQGVACFGHGPGGMIRQRIGAPALCLERGACTQDAPPNAASFLINHACKLVHRLTGTARFFAYADPNAGEYGAVYQAAGWAYLGQGLYGSATRTHRYAVLPPGADGSDPANWQTTRALRRDSRHLSFAEARAAGWQISSREAKHVYTTCVGRDRKARLLTLVTLPYPKPEKGLARLETVP